jgi:hypothetical protein
LQNRWNFSKHLKLKVLLFEICILNRIGQKVSFCLTVLKLSSLQPRVKRGWKERQESNETQ